MTKITRVWLGVVVALAVSVSGGLFAQAGDPQRAVDDAYQKFRNLKEGKNADYIPALAKVDPNLYGIALVTVDGKVITAGDVKTEVSIQSISKVFTMAQVVQEQGLEAIEKRIGVDATGARFNSIIAVEGVRTVVGTGAPEMNPLVNPGAISATSMVRGSSADEVWNKIIGIHNDFAGRSLSVLQDVYKSEADTNQRNQAIGALMLAYGYIKDNWQQAVDLYTRQCSIGVNAQDLATMAATLAFGGTNPVTKKQVMDPSKVPGVLAVMATAGLYDDSGKWLYHTGLPAKSGVGGGIIAVSRSLQEIIVAILFVAMFGFGPFAGAVTLAFATIGFLSKLLAEDIEDIDPAQAEAIRATGASWLQWLSYGIQPQVMARLIGLSLYRLDINFRESAVLGIVGAGGIGDTLNTAFARYEYDIAAAVLLIIIGIVTVAEYSSGLIRARVQ